MPGAPCTGELSTQLKDAQGRDAAPGVCHQMVSSSHGRGHHEDSTAGGGSVVTMGMATEAQDTGLQDGERCSWDSESFVLQVD